MTSVTQRRIKERMSLDPSLLRVLADPVRSFVVYSLVPEAKTVKQLASELGCPPTRLYYHLQQLEKHGLVFVQRSRLVSGIQERHYRAAAREFVLDRDALGNGSTSERERSEALLAFVFDQTRLEIARGLEQGRIDIRRGAPAPGSLIAYRNVLKLDRAQAERLYRRLHAFWMEYEAIAKQPAEDGEFFAFTVALYPNAPIAPQAAAPETPARKARRSTRA